MELLVSLGIVAQNGGRLKLGAQRISVPTHHIHKCLCPKSIHETEGSASEGGEADTKDRTNI